MVCHNNWEAVEIYNSIISLSPLDPLGYCDLGHVYILFGNPHKALVYLEKALELDQDQPLAKYRKSYALFQLDQFDESFGLLDQIKEEDYHSSYWGLKAMLFLEFQNIHESVRCFKKALELDPNNQLLWKNLDTLDMVMKEQEKEKE
eukprot:TRINITY_DN7133_c0_g2_i7.p1 TRINITY_DN7133_c0_g2~~TRINITY_DN7133_c0_g2_i7.p1  ORF type:complete len:147 (-),score=43.94 TRINITY_DN7133_c0_g2_i7:102-542(-)